MDGTVFIVTNVNVFKMRRRQLLQAEYEQKDKLQEREAQRRQQMAEQDAQLKVTKRVRSFFFYR